MNWIVPFIIGLVIAWLIQFLIDFFYWRQRELEGTANVDCSQISADYEKEIEGLNLSLDNYKSNIETKDVEISGLNASLEAKDVELAELSASLAALNADIEAKDRNLTDLSASLEAKDVEVSGLSASLDGKNAELAALSASLAAKDVEAEGLRGRLLGNIKSPGWFDWGEYDFFNWGEGDDVEFIGTAEAGETVDITYGRETVGTAEVDSSGNWKLPWAVPAMFLPSMLGFIRRDRDGAEVEASRGEMSAVIDAEAPVFPNIDADADIDVEVESGSRSSWFSWPSLDFSGWRAGEERELSGTGEPGGSVDVQYNGEVIESVPVDDDGRWSLSWLVPTGFAAGALGFLGRDRNGSEIEASIEADADLEMSSADVDVSLPEVEIDASMPDVDVDVDASDRAGWFNWPDWDFSGWGAGEDRELSGVGEPGGSVDINYDGEYQGTAKVDDDGKWSFPFKVPALFAAGGLGFLARDRDGAEVEASAGADFDLDMPSADIDVDSSLPEVEVDASLPEVEVGVDADANIRDGWFNWPDWDFSGWGAGEERELSGFGEPGGSVDVQYNGEVVGTAPVDDDGHWSFSWLLPAGFAAGGLGILGRNRDGAEVEASAGADFDLDMPDVSANLGIAGAAVAGAAAVGLGGAFVDLVNTTQTTVRLEDIDGDDLTKIWGIGPKTKLNFYRRGITTFEQFASIDPDTLSEIMKESRLMSARIPKDPHGDWTALADLAAKGDWGGFDALTAKIKPPEPKRKKKRKPSVKLDGDKLSDIAGIGRGTWKALHGMGYNSYAKLADISPEEVEVAMKKSRALNAPGAPTPAEAHASWTELAGLAAAGDWNAFNARNAGLDTAVVTTPTQTSFDAMGYDFSGWEAGQRRSFNGNEAAGSVIKFYYDGDLIGEAVAGDDGSWEFPFTVPDGFTPSLMTFTMS